MWTPLLRENGVIWYKDKTNEKLRPIESSVVVVKETGLIELRLNF